MEPRSPRARMPAPLARLIDRSLDRGAEALRLRARARGAVVHHELGRGGRRLLDAASTGDCLRLVREAAAPAPGAAWGVGRLAWDGAPLLVQWRRCLRGERAVIQLGATTENVRPRLRRSLQATLLRALAERHEWITGCGAGPEAACALRLAIDASDLLGLVEAAVDLALPAALSGDALALELAREAGRGLEGLLTVGQVEAAALLVAECRLLPSPGELLVRRCRRLLVAPLLASGLRLPDRRPTPPLT